MSARWQGEREMPLPELTTVAEGDLPGGQHWILRAGGTREATDADLGVSYFAALLPRTTGLAALTPRTPPATRWPPNPTHTR
jgi:hypothetical protein